MEGMGLGQRAYDWAKRMVEKDWHLIEQVAQKLMRDGYYHPAMTCRES